ncbi:MAG: hypothetical protein JWR52_3904 [Marmoricola sp.]|nr:hypothetical protein [Marmoricola sp.]
MIELNERGVGRKAETADQARTPEWKAPNLIPSPAPMHKTNEGRLETSILRHLLVLVSPIVIERSLRRRRRHLEACFSSGERGELLRSRDTF